MTAQMSYQRLGEVLRRSGCEQDAAEVHGGIVGAICAAEDGARIDLPRILDPARTAVDPHAAVDPELRALCEQLRADLADHGMPFAPLLPDDEESLARRVQALAAWCEGFLFGLATHRQLDLTGCSEAVREIVDDMTEFTRAELSEEDDEEIEEAAYAELIEYIRVGVQLIYLELRGERAAPTLH